MLSIQRIHTHTHTINQQQQQSLKIVVNWEAIVVSEKKKNPRAIICIVVVVVFDFPINELEIRIKKIRAKLGSIKSIRTCSDLHRISENKTYQK